MMGSYSFDLSDETIRHATTELVTLYRQRRSLAAARSDILVHKTRATLKALQNDSQERAIHAGILAGNVTALPVRHDNREVRPESAKIIMFPGNVRRFEQVLREQGIA